MHKSSKCKSLNTMAYKIKPSTQCLQKHIAVRMKDCIVVNSCTKYSTQEIWVYNLWTEQWRKCSIVKGMKLPLIHSDQCSVAMGSVIYLFGGLNFSKLMATEDGSFAGHTIIMGDRTKMPSPRVGHCGWEYEDAMWIFGGEGTSPVGYLNDHGDFVLRWMLPPSGHNNQLLCFDPSSQTWANVACAEDVPSPRSGATATIIKHKLWLFGGRSTVLSTNDLYELNMHSLVWTQINIPNTPQCIAFYTTLTPITATKLAAKIGIYGSRFTWILDVESYSWRQHSVSVLCDCMHCTTFTTGLNNDAMLLGAHIGTCDNPLFSVKLEPKCLQQLAMRIICENRNVLPWKSLPSSLIRKMMGTFTE